LRWENRASCNSDNKFSHRKTLYISTQTGSERVYVLELKFEGPQLRITEKVSDPGFFRKYLKQL
jgi:hypothetical protein